MASATATPQMLKPSPTPNITNLLSQPTIFTSKNLSLPTKPIKFQPLFISSFSLTNKKTHFPSIISFVAQNPQTQFVVEETEEKEVKFVWEDDVVDDDSGAPISDWEGEDSAIRATVEEIGEGGDEVLSEEGEDDDAEVLSEEVSEEAKIFVGNLPYDFDHQGLAQLFDQAGTVEIAEVIYNRATNQSRGFGFVTMRTVEEAEVAVEKFHGHTVGGRTLTVNKAAPRGSRVERPSRSSEPAIRIYVGNLPWDVDSSRLEQIFSEHGNVVEARVVSDRETGRSRGFGFVTMSSQAEMNGAISALDGESVNGRAIRVNVAEERPRRSFY